MRFQGCKDTRRNQGFEVGEVSHSVSCTVNLPCMQSSLQRIKLQDSLTVLGVMSGTSLDGLDLAVIRFKNQGSSWGFQILDAHTIPYETGWVDRLRTGHTLDTTALDDLDQQYTTHLGSMVSDFLITTSHSVNLICSHGHTILHQPHLGITLQIGNQPQLARVVGLPVICDFRVQDVALGGQGAPLVPIGDQMLFSEYTACINLGGFANISYQQNGQRIAYDIAPVNIVMNDLAQQLSVEYDAGGAFAKAGTPNQELLTRLNALSYYKKSPPKSLGKEWVELHIDPLLAESFENGLTLNDALATINLHAAQQIAMAINQMPVGRVLFTGGGVYNEFLMERIKDLTTHELVVPDDDLINYKEALIFGLLGILRLHDQVNCLASVTGATRDHSSGEILLPGGEA